MVFAVHAMPSRATSYPFAGDAAVFLMGSGRFGVDIFFALSAYLITTLLLREKAASGTINLRRFYTRRAARIWPLLFTFLAIGALLGEIVGTEAPDTAQLLGLVTLSGNWLMAFDGLPPHAYAPLWSLCLEWQFYMLWPLVVLAVRDIRIAAIGMIVMPLIIRLIAEAHGLPIGPVSVTTFARTDAFGIGALLAVIRFRIPAQYAVPLGAASILLAEAMLWGPLAPLSFTAAAIGAGSLLSAAMHTKHVPPASAWLGERTYGLYVLHASPLAVTSALTTGQGDVVRLIGVAAAFAAVVILAHLSHRWIEAPFMTISSRHVAIKPRARSLASNALIFASTASNRASTSAASAALLPVPSVVPTAESARLEMATG